jgi:hypothetical protein
MGSFASLSQPYNRQMKRTPLVGVVMGSKSDYETLQPAIEILNEFSGDRRWIRYAVPSCLSPR